LLTAALAVGPLNLIRRRPNPVSTDLRRDIGIWAAIYGIVHTIAGLNVHMRGHVLRYFAMSAPDRGTKAFLLANWLGLVATLLLLLLLSLSNDISLRRLGTQRWKFLQQATYVVLVAVVLHGAAYQIIEKRQWIAASVFSGLAVIALIMQSAGVRARLKESQKRRSAD
jgi:sulfoxide reductase heme-binding subunit YedZ